VRLSFEPTQSVFKICFELEYRCDVLHFLCTNSDAAKKFVEPCQAGKGEATLTSVCVRCVACRARASASLLNCIISRHFSFVMPKKQKKSAKKKAQHDPNAKAGSRKPVRAVL